MLGTFFEISVGDAPEELITAAFAEARRLEKIFNLQDPQSEINKGGDPSPEFTEVRNQALEMQRASAGAFCAAASSGRFDFNGIAKGYIVDKTVHFLRAGAPASSGSVNAGGDMLFFNCEPQRIELRLGTHSQPVFRELQLLNRAVATSSPTFLQGLPGSSTRYDKACPYTVTAVASTCSVADALTKVGLFAKSEVAQACALTYKAQIMVFDSAGGLAGSFGEYET